MQYQLQTLRIACQREQFVDVKGVEAVGSGLCYHYSHTIPGLLVITDKATGKALPGAYATTEEQAQELIERLTPHFHWWLSCQQYQEQFIQHIARTMRSLGLFVIYL